jgi:hypothetical protein
MASAVGTLERLSNENKTMKILNRIALTAAIFLTGFASQAAGVNGYFRSNGTYVAPYFHPDYGSLGRTSPGFGSGYIYRNPYAAYPSVHVHGYFRSGGTYVAPHVRTPPNWTVKDNLSYRGYGSIRVPRYSVGR